MSRKWNARKLSEAAAQRYDEQISGLEVNFAAQGAVLQKEATEDESLLRSEKSNIDKQKYQTLGAAQRKVKNTSALND